ncbi:MAG TPA: diphthine--ammonia ligase [Candidatus Limnocylindria bacterium]|nr:diphthine--ammonia ligase [Candidatus Limnocylindria bacterium]
MWSGGKDSALALLRARASGLRVTRLVNFHDDASDRVRFHATRAGVVRAQAEAIGIELRQFATGWDAYEDALVGALAGLRAEGFQGVIFGDIHLADVRAWYEERVRASGLEHLEPIWGEPSADLVREFVAGGSRAVITCVEDAKLDTSWLGRVIDHDFVRDVGALSIDAAGENGEYHSFVFAGPLFRSPLRWRPGERRRDGGFSQLDIELEDQPARL